MPERDWPSNDDGRSCGTGSVFDFKTNMFRIRTLKSNFPFPGRTVSATYFCQPEIETRLQTRCYKNNSRRPRRIQRRTPRRADTMCFPTPTLARRLRSALARSLFCENFPWPISAYRYHYSTAAVQSGAKLARQSNFRIRVIVVIRAYEHK